MVVCALDQNGIKPEIKTERYLKNSKIFGD